MLRRPRDPFPTVDYVIEGRQSQGPSAWHIAFPIVFCVHLATYVLVSLYALLSIVGQNGTAPDANIGLAFALTAYEGLALPWSLMISPYREDLGFIVLASLNLAMHLLVCAAALALGRAFGRCRRCTR